VDCGDPLDGGVPEPALGLVFEAAILNLRACVESRGSNGAGDTWFWRGSFCWAFWIMRANRKLKTLGKIFVPHLTHKKGRIVDPAFFANAA
jgi:hypothetical protein